MFQEYQNLMKEIKTYNGEVIFHCMLWSVVRSVFGTLREGFVIGPSLQLGF